MAVDALRETHHVNRVGMQDLGVLWSAQSYRPEITAALRTIRALPWRPLSAICSNSIGPGPHPTFASKGHSCLKTKNVLGMVVGTDDVDFVEPSEARRWPHYQIQHGDLVLNVTGAGSVGRVGIYFGTDLPLTNQHLARLSIAPVADAAFVCAFLSSWWGERALEQGISGSTGQLNLVNEHIRQIPVFTPDLAAQRYVGDKVRQAEQLRGRARRMLGGVRLHHAHLIPPFRPTREKWNTFRLRAAAVDDVIVPHFYPPAVAEYLAGQDHKSLNQLCEAVYSGETYDPDHHGVDQATSRSCSGRFLRRPCNKVRTPPRTDLDLQPHDLLLTNAAHDKAYIGTDVTYYHGGPRNIPSAKVMVLRPDRTLVPASYLFAYLQTPVGYLQIQSAIRGISAGIRAQDVAAIRIPLPTLTEEERGTWLAMDMRMAMAGAAEQTASLLSTAAVQIVERMIEGHLNESELVAAQAALDAGDRGPDRSILASLRRTEGQGSKPLIPDVDELYSLLDSSEDDSA